MSRDFKKDYQEELQHEIPDLWDRIEAELPPKEKTPQLRNVVGRPTIRNRKRRKFRKIRNIVAVAAACLCISITGFAFFHGRGAAKYAATETAVEMAEEAADMMVAADADTVAEDVAREAEAGNETSNELSDSIALTAGSMQEEAVTANLEQLQDTMEMAAIEEENQSESDAETESSIGDANVVEVLNKPGYVNAKAGILINAKSGEVLFEQDAEVPLPPASTTKMMTALLTIEAIERGELSLEQVVTVDNNARNITPVGGSVLALPIEEGEEVSIKDLLYAVLLKSDCVCCNILAEQVCGDVETFV